MILTFDKQQAIRPISENNSHKWEQLAKEVNDVTMYNIFGVDFMIDVESNVDNPAYEDLLRGSQYEINGRTYTQGGLEKVFAYLIYAQYLKETGIEDTFTGLVKQVRNETDTAKEGERGNMVNNAYKVAYVNADRVKHYLDNSDLFPKWQRRTINKTANTPNFLTINKK